MLFPKLVPRKDKNYKAPNHTQFQKLSKVVTLAVQKLSQSAEQLQLRIKQILWHKFQSAKYYTEVKYDVSKIPDKLYKKIQNGRHFLKWNSLTSVTSNLVY